MSCATYALACFMNDELLASSQYESAIFALANSFLKSLKEFVFNTKTVFTLLQLDPGVSITFYMHGKWEQKHLLQKTRKKTR